MASLWGFRQVVNGADPEPLPAVLIRNPGNAHDPNAIEVHCPAGSGPDGIGMLGHIPAPLAARMAPHLDGGGRLHAEIVVVLIHPDHPERPGITVAISPVD